MRVEPMKVSGRYGIRIELDLEEAASYQSNGPLQSAVAATIQQEIERKARETAKNEQREARDVATRETSPIKAGMEIRVRNACRFVGVWWRVIEVVAASLSDDGVVYSCAWVKRDGSLGVTRDSFAALGRDYSRFEVRPATGDVP